MRIDHDFLKNRCKAMGTPHMPVKLNEPGLILFARDTDLGLKPHQDLRAIQIDEVSKFFHGLAPLVPGLLHPPPTQTLQDFLQRPSPCT